MSSSSRMLHLKAEPVAQLTSLGLIGCRVPGVSVCSTSQHPINMMDYPEFPKTALDPWSLQLAMVCDIVLWQALLILKQTQLFSFRF